MAAFGAESRAINYGEIAVSGDSSAAMQVFGNGAAAQNRGSIDVSSDFTMGMSRVGSFDLNMDNAGHIAMAGTHAIGISVGSPRQFSFEGRITNSGTIDTAGDGAAGVSLIGGGNHFVNSGEITTNGGSLGSESAAGVVVRGFQNVVENTKTGVIRSENPESPALDLSLAAVFIDETSRTENHGLIEAPSIAIKGGLGRETIINDGHIVGDIVLGENFDEIVLEERQPD